jgi:nucleotide-binding universal stress UspA family protein
MAMIQNILFPVDFSPACAAMAPFVRRSASITSAKVTLLHVLEPAASTFELLVRPPREVEEDRKSVARERLNSFLESEFRGADAQRLLVEGDAAVEIAGVAKEGGFDLIIMPTHAGTFRRMLIGSTTAKVLNDTDTPVQTTQHAETIIPRQVQHREWVCLVGLQEDSQRVVRYAAEAAETFHTNLTLVHAIAPSEPWLPVQLDLEERVESAARHAARERIEQLQRAVGTHAPVRIVVGPIKEALIEAARKLEADVVVIGRSPEPGSRGRLRDLTYAVVRDAPCPVLSI